MSYSKWKKKVRKELWEEQHGHCCWCDKPMALEDATIEHIRAKADGGTDDKINLQVACESCNNERGRRLNTALQCERRRQIEEAEAEVKAKRRAWRINRKAATKTNRKLPRGRKRIFDRFPPARYYRQNGLDFG